MRGVPCELGALWHEERGDATGQRWRPSDGKVFIGKARVSGSTADMKGCVLGGLICLGQTLTRVE